MVPDPPPPDTSADLLRRVDTSGLQQGDAPTVALIVVNRGERDVPEAVADFHARFPVRATVGAQPVTIWDADGHVVPSRLASQTLTADPALPPDRLWWTLHLQFVARAVPARGWRAYAATYGCHPDSDTPARWEKRAGLAVYETDIHEGNLPVAGTVAAV